MTSKDLDEAIEVASQIPGADRNHRRTAHLGQVSARFRVLVQVAESAPANF
jgi:hypothetical protein